MPDHYGAIAKYYDRLAFLVYGQPLRRSQRFYLDRITSGSQVLIVGGGSGRILRELQSLKINGLKITYCDASQAMINLAKELSGSPENVEFVCDPLERLQLRNQYDVIITPFFLDSFSGERLIEIFEQLNGLLHQSGRWIISDFEVSGSFLRRCWQKALVILMVLFFRLCCNITATRLEDFDSLFKRYHYVRLGRASFFGKFIFAGLYEKK